MKKIIKITLGLANMVPYITFILIFISVGPGETVSNLLFDVLGVLTFVLIPGLAVFYIVNVYRSSSVASNQKHLWAALLFFGSIVVYPFYWYLHIWREPEKI
ncbi:hypothetical protein ACFLWC_06125 [Chloroflexota bacterium]